MYEDLVVVSFRTYVIESDFESFILERQEIEGF